MTIFHQLWPKRQTAVRSGWILITGAIVFLCVPSAVFSWLPPLSRPSVGNRAPIVSSTELFESYSDEESRPVEDFTGKTIYQRTFYRLSPDSQVQLPNSVMIEERLRFLPNTAKQGFILPVGPRTLILREGSEGQSCNAWMMLLIFLLDSI